MAAKHAPDRPIGFDIAAIGDMIVLRSPAGEIVHFTTQEALEVAQRLVDCALDGLGRRRAD